MDLQFALDECVSHRDQYNLNAFPSCELHSRNEIAISGNQNNPVNNPFAGQPGNVEPDFHIHMLLLQIGLEVIRR